MVVLKNRAKSLGLSQRTLANKLGVSVPTIKRWFGGKTITLAQLKSVCDELGLAMSEVIASSEQNHKAQFNYTLEQERFLSQHPEMLAFFDLLNRGSGSAQIQRKHGLSQKGLEKTLANLDKIGLIEWLPKNKVRLKVQGEPVWRENGPLAQTFGGHIISDFLKSMEKRNVKFMLHDYSPEDFLTIQVKMSDLIDFATKANRRSQFHPDKSKSYGLYIALQGYNWCIEDYLKS